MRQILDRDEQCIGNREDECRTPPAFVVAGDLACSRHLVAVVRLRCDETRKPGCRVEVIA